MSEMQQRYSDMAPGMDQVVQAGDTLVMRDNDGNEFSISGRLDDATLAFLKAFDEWFHANRAPARLHQDILAAMHARMVTAFNDLPMWLQQELPSFRAGGIVLRDRPLRGGGR